MSRGFYALNFFSPAFADQLKRGRKTATIRIGDKSRKYERGQLLWVTIGHQHSPREKIFTAVIDSVEVKKARELSPRDIEHDNPEFRRVDETLELHAPDLRPRDRSRGDGHRGPLLAGARAAAGVRQRRASLAQLGADAVEYRFLTTWLLESPREPVWEAIYDQRAWPSWWRGVTDVVELDPGDESASARTRASPGARSSPTTSCSRPRPAQVERPRLIEADAFGELAGAGAGGCWSRAG